MFRWENAQSLVGLSLTLLLCWALSEDRKRFPWRLALGAIGVQVGLVALMFGVPQARAVVSGINDAVDGLSSATAQGTQFVFGYLGGGAQPMLTEDERYALSFNGEIYNFQELRKELEGLGHHFRTHSDSEVILEAYRAWGPKCVERLHGMFVFALYDQANRQLLLAQDGS